MLQQMKLSRGGNLSSSNSPGKMAAASAAAATTEEHKHVSNTGKSPFRPSNATSSSHTAADKKGSLKADDEIEEDIV